MECAAAGHAIPALYTCTDAACDLRPLCGVHVMAHQQWSHTVTMLVADCDGAPSPGSLVGVTHCGNPSHSGADGTLSLLCKPCNTLVCRECMKEHLDEDHTVWSVERAGAEAAAGITAALTELREGMAHQVAQASSARQLMDTLVLSRGTALEALAATTARLHAEVDAKHAALAAAIEQSYEARVGTLQRAMTAARSSIAELATMLATAEASLGPSATSVMRVHVSRSVQLSLPLARCRYLVNSELGSLGLVYVEPLGSEVDMGRLVCPGQVAAAKQVRVYTCLHAP